jgi:hypothetical protein
MDRFLTTLIIFAAYVGMGWNWLIQLYLGSRPHQGFLGLASLVYLMWAGILTLIAFVILLFILPFAVWSLSVVGWVALCLANLAFRK